MNVTRWIQTETTCKLSFAEYESLSERVQRQNRADSNVIVFIVYDLTEGTAKVSVKIKV